jgi:hypothetical protein
VPPLRVYVAAGSLEAERAALWIERLRAAGVEITFDWTPEVIGGAADSRNPEVAAAELNAVVRAEVVWFLVPMTGSSGGGFELGFAYRGNQQTTICSGPHLARFHFGVLLVEYDTDEEAFQVIVDMHRRRSA